MEYEEYAGSISRYVWARSLVEYLLLVVLFLQGRFSHSFTIGVLAQQSNCACELFNPVAALSEPDNIAVQKAVGGNDLHFVYSLSSGDRSMRGFQRRKRFSLVQGGVTDGLANDYEDRAVDF